MDILSYLSELVQSRKFVGISGLGTICKKKLPGRYDVETHAFIPPSYVLDFTEEIKEDILLPEFISKKRNVSTETAVYFVNEFSADLRQQLNDQQEAALGELGKLKQIAGKLVFEPADGLPYGFDFYGLPSVKAAAPVTVPADIEVSDHITEVEEQVETIGDPAESTAIPSITEQEEELTIEAVIADNEGSEENPGKASAAIEAEDRSFTPDAVPIVAAENTEEAYAQIEALNNYRANSTDQPISVTQQEEVIWNLKEPTVTAVTQANEYHTLPDVPPDPEVEKTTSVTIKVLIGIAVLLLIVIGLYFIKPELFKGSRDSRTPSVAPVSINETTPVVLADSTLVQDTTAVDALPKPSADTTTSTKAAKPAATGKSIVTTPAVSTVPETADSTSTLEIIGAAVLNKTEADYFIWQMKKSGVTAKVIPAAPGKRLKMSLGTFTDKAQAQKELERLKEKLKIKGIYIYRNKQH